MGLLSYSIFFSSLLLVNLIFDARAVLSPASPARVDAPPAIKQ